MTNKKRWLTSTVLGIGLASLFSDMSHEAVTVMLPAFLASMGAAAGILGTIEGLADGLSSVAKLYGGTLADRLRHRKPLCAFGYGAMALTTAVIALAGNWALVLAGRCLCWAARGIRTPARKVLLAEAVTPETYGKAFGLERTMDTLGAVLAPLAAGGLLAAGLSMRSVIWFATIPAFFAAGAIMLLVKETPNEEPHHRPMLKGLGELPSNFRKLMACVGIFGSGDFAHSLLILYAVTVLAPNWGAPRAAAAGAALYTLHNIVYAGISFPAGWMADRWRKPLLLAVGYGAGALFCILLVSGATSLPMLALIFALGGAYVGMEETLEDSIAAELLPRNRRGSGFGALAIVNGLGDMISSIAVGWLWARYGPRLAFGCAGVVMGAGMLATLLYARNLRIGETQAT